MITVAPEREAVHPWIDLLQGKAAQQPLRLQPLDCQFHAIRNFPHRVLKIAGGNGKAPFDCAAGLFDKLHHIVGGQQG